MSGDESTSYLVFWQCPSFGPLMGNAVLTVERACLPTFAEIKALRQQIKKENKIPERYFLAICSLMPIEYPSRMSRVKKGGRR